MAGPQGKFVWYELATSDKGAAEAFYKSVVGWTMQDSGMVDFPYTILHVGEQPIGGLMTLPQDACDAGAKPGWMGYIGVEDVDAKADAVAKAGGKIYRAPEDIPEVGRFAVVADPQGAVFTLFKGQGEDQPDAAPGANGHVGWHELMTTDHKAALAFYSSLFGWTKDESLDMGPMGIYQLFAYGSNAVGGMMDKPPAVPAPFWTFYFNVEDIDEAIDRIKAGGGQVINGPMEVPGGSWIAQALDPQGVVFSLAAPPKGGMAPTM
ncbi:MULTISPECIES: VOC family protein [unclassified Chelatococcus]|uniref:VOC family protein n=1 Tax=unclassified Chelatococcus TaxID=2638111 RepID=UPI001BCA6D61|nr:MULTISPECIES: VOC family protein [unclassified Chelatococcus]MBS7696104.1 VOC family protein [Chelatococcus sp. YT9]MBX3557869.1 VOC family protein [Chelatococcus sp.]